MTPALVCGRGDTSTYDAPWLVACFEQSAIEADAAGLPDTARAHRQSADAIARAAGNCTDRRCHHAGADCRRWAEVRREERRLGFCRVFRGELRPAGAMNVPAFIMPAGFTPTKVRSVRKVRVLAGPVGSRG